MARKRKQRTGTQAARAQPRAYVDGHAASYVRKYIRCGKAHCETRHGPYWYLVWREGSNVRTKYIGKVRSRLILHFKAKLGIRDH